MTQINRALLGTVALAGLLPVLLPQAAGAAGAPTPAQLEQMITDQQRQLDALKAALTKAQADAQAARSTADQKGFPEFLKSVDIGGTIEVEATSTGDFADNDSSDITLGKVEVYIDTKPADFVSTHVQFLYEDGDDNITLDEAFATLGDTERFPLYLQAGKWAVPFGGSFDTAMSTDPLTKDLGETSEAAVLVGATWQGATVEGYIYNGDSQKAGGGNNIDQFGISLGYEGEIDGLSLAVGGGYINNIADSNGLTEALGTNATALDGYVGGLEAHATVGYAGFTLSGSYMAATKAFKSGELAFKGQGAEPAAWGVEASYTAPIFKRETTFAATVQGTEEALALSLPETRYGGAVTVNLFENTDVTAEYLHDEDYDVADGGTGNDGHTATLKLAVGF